MPTTIDGFHQFNVKEYSRLKEMDVGSYISSDTFAVGGYDWAIFFYPHGEDKTDTGYVSVFLGLTNDCGTVLASFELTLLDQSGKGSHYVNSTDKRVYTHLYDRRTIWGYKFFMKNLSLESSDYLKDGSLSFCCTVRVVQDRIIPKKLITNIPPPPSGMLEKDLKYLLDSETGSDIVFHVKGYTFKAHKVILAARSPVFKAQLYELVGNPALEEVELMDIEPSVFKALLSFIYSDKLPDSQECMGSMSHMIQHLLVAADRFGLDGLKQLCEAKLCEMLNVDMVAATLTLAHDHNFSQLKTICMDFAEAEFAAVIRTEGYKYIEKAHPCLKRELLQQMESKRYAGTLPFTQRGLFATALIIRYKF